MVEIIPKPPIRIPLWQSILFYLSIGLILGVTAGFFVLDHFQKKASENLSEIEQTLAKVTRPEEITLEKEILALSKNIDKFSQLLDLHKNPSNFFVILEKDCHPKVYFSKVSLKPQEFQAFLSGQAESFGAIGQQVLIFQKNKFIKGVKLTDLSLAKEGGVEFELALELKPEIFK